MVADVLSRKIYCNNVMIKENQPTLHEEFQRLSLELVDEGCVNTSKVQPTLKDQIREAQKEDPDVKEIKDNMRRGQAPGFSDDERGIIWFGKRIFVPN